MLNWAASCGYVRGNPLEWIKQLPEHTDKREVSRALTRKELERLIARTPDKMRQLYYLFSGRCGLRWTEIKLLEWEDLDLTKGLIHLRPEATKSRRADVVEIAADLLQRLRVKGKGKGRIFRSSPILRTFKEYLKRAKIAYEVGGEQADRKCLRKTFGTHLALSGVDPWDTAGRMRHSDPKLTMQIYTDLGLLRKARIARNGRRRSRVV